MASNVLELTMNSELILMLDLSRRSDVMKRIKEKTIERKCLCCDEPPTTRGLCESCYNRFKYVRRSLGTKREQASFEASCIREGKILEAHDKNNKPANVFRRIAKKLIG